MSLLRAASAALAAVAAYLRFVYPVKQIREIQKDIEAYEDEIFRLGNIGDGDSKLRLEVVSKRKQRADQLLESLRSSIDHID